MAHQVAGVEVVEANHFETPSGGEVIIGRCVTDANHMIVFAHIELGEIPQLAEALHDAYLTYVAPKGDA
jgi:hypothetical protein